MKCWVGLCRALISSASTALTSAADGQEGICDRCPYQGWRTSHDYVQRIRPRYFQWTSSPNILVKAIIAGDIDRMEALGIYEVAPEDFALCDSYVLPKWKCSASYVQGSICFVPKWHNRGVWQIVNCKS